VAINDVAPDRAVSKAVADGAPPSGAADPDSSLQADDGEIATCTTESAKVDNTSAAENREPDQAGQDGDVAAGEDAELETSAKPRQLPVRLAVVFGLVAVVAVAGLVGWLGWRSYQSHQVAVRPSLFLQVGRQGAINLTTVDYEHADADVQRILDSATGTFYDDFAKRSKPFVDVVKQAKSKSVGTVTEAGLESESSTEAQVLVAVTVKTSNAGAADQEPRAWRMRLSVQKVGDQAKVSNVEFVP
jgi:Mce-associated membrane protein